MGGIGSIFGSKPPEPEPLPPLPTRDDESVQAGVEKQRKRRRAARATILTRGEQQLGEANVTRPQAGSGDTSTGTAARTTTLG